MRHRSVHSANTCELPLKVDDLTYFGQAPFRCALLQGPLRLRVSPNVDYVQRNGIGQPLPLPDTLVSLSLPSPRPAAKGPVDYDGTGWK
jgi:hypothetical protein